MWCFISFHPSAHITTQPTCPQVIIRTDHEDWVSLTLSHGGPSGAVLVLITAKIVVRCELFLTSDFYTKKFGGKPHFPLLNRASGMRAAVVGSGVMVAVEEQKRIAFCRSQDVSTVCAIGPHIFLFLQDIFQLFVHMISKIRTLNRQKILMTCSSKQSQKR